MDEIIIDMAMLDNCQQLFLLNDKNTIYRFELDNNGFYFKRSEIVEDFNNETEKIISILNIDNTKIQKLNNTEVKIMILNTDQNNIYMYDYKYGS